MNTKNLIVLGVLLINLFCISCDEGIYKKVDIILIDSITNNQLPENNIKDFYQSQIDKNDKRFILSISFLNRYAKLTDLENIDSISLLKKLKARVVLNNLGLIWYYFNNDSIFYITDSSGIYYLNLTDINGSYTRKLRIPDLNIDGNKQFLSMNSYSEPFHYVPHNNIFIFGLHNQFYTKKDSAEFNFRYRRVLMKFNNDEAMDVVSYFGQTPKPNNKLFLGDFGQMHSALLKDLVVLSYSQSDSIYTYNMMGELQNSHYAKARKFHPYQKAFDFRKSSNRAYLSEVERSGDFYSNIIAGEKYILRVVMRKKLPPEIDANGYDKNNKINWGLIVLDNSFNYIGEMDMSFSRGDFNAIFPLKGNKFLMREEGGISDKYYVYEIRQ